MLDNNKKEWNSLTAIMQFLLFGLCVLLIGNFIIGIYGMLQKNSTMPDDFIMRYRESRYLLENINTYDVVLQNIPFENNIGPLWDDVAGYTPWGMAMGIIFNFAFLPENIARIAYGTVHITVMILTFCIISKIFIKQRKYALIFLLIAIAIPGWGTAISYLNFGAVFGALLFLSVLIYEDHPIIAGILLGLAATKPQLAMPFYLAYLLKRRYKTLSVAIIIPTFFWGIASILAGINPVSMLLQFSAIGQNVVSILGGWLIPFGVYFDMNFGGKTFEIFGAIICIFMAFVFWNNLRKTDNTNNNFLFFSIPAILSGMWTYSQEHDRTVLMIYLVALFYILTEADIVIKKKKLWVGLCLFSIIMSPEALVRLQNNIIPSAEYVKSFYLLLRNMLWILGLFFITSIPNQSQMRNAASGVNSNTDL